MFVVSLEILSLTQSFFWLGNLILYSSVFLLMLALVFTIANGYLQHWDAFLGWTLLVFF
jgi:hypothetical protein